MDTPLKSLRLLPDFVVIGAMKCATTTLHEQLARQPGLLMSRPKEPNFFKPQNVGRERLRASTWRNALVQAPVLGTLRRALIPGSLSERVKSYWRMGVDPPRIPPDLEARLREVFDADLAQLGSWLGIPLDCQSFRSVSELKSVDWSDHAEEFHAKWTQRTPSEQVDLLVTPGEAL